MRLLGLELSDAGIMLAGSDPVRLLEIDGTERESPGYAFPEKKQLVVGKAAQQKAHLLPRLVISHFWDQLSTEPLDHPGPYTQQNHAEIACAHLAKIWQTVKKPGDEIIIAVPGCYHQDHLGLLLGIANELSIPVKGFIPIALAAADQTDRQVPLIHLDIHLHRTEISTLKQDAQLTFEKSVTVVEKGLVDLQRAWVEAIAAEFVRTTRFDPLHQAASEQELFDRLPGVLEQVDQYSTVEFEMTGGTVSYRVTLARDLFIRNSLPLFNDIVCHLEDIATGGQQPVLQLSHRIARLPGLQQALAVSHHTRCLELAPGAAALGAVQLWEQISQQDSGQNTSFFTSRPGAPGTESGALKTSEPDMQTLLPSHLLYNHIAYPLSEKPLFIGTGIQNDESGIRIQGQIHGVSRKHCSVQLLGTQTVLNDLSTYGTFVDDNRVDGSTTLQLGQVIRVGTPGETLRLIACLNHDET
ncbi:MAG: FHA domain-containing protein [Deltaproteobacteria bacterium]|jgi:hypothetical protein|nr:FHA domain-containing protein [Deltaproteobacteria bacterium]